jgi:hypothetical protein
MRKEKQETHEHENGVTTNLSQAENEHLQGIVNILSGA